MNFSQLHERIRSELQRRIERGSLTAGTLARRAGLQAPHLSNFLRHKRRLSLPALDRLLAALNLSVADLLPASEAAPPAAPVLRIPLTSQDAAMHQDLIRESAVTSHLSLPSHLLPTVRAARSRRKLRSERFVAVAISAQQAAPMEPLLRPGSIVILDRHAPWPEPSPDPTHIYAIARPGHLAFGFLSLQGSFLLLRPYQNTSPLQLFPVGLDTELGELITGRVCGVLLPA